MKKGQCPECGVIGGSHGYVNIQGSERMCTRPLVPLSEEYKCLKCEKTFKGKPGPVTCVFCHHHLIEHIAGKFFDEQRSLQLSG